MRLETKQDVFDAVVRHLISQGRPAIDENGSCRYRTASGLSCAVGGIMSDEVYEPDLEHTAICSLINAGRIPKWRKKDFSAILADLQRVHDNLSSYANGNKPAQDSVWQRDSSGTPVGWDIPKLQERLEHIAQTYSLSTAVLDQCLAPTAEVQLTPVLEFT